MAKLVTGLFKARSSAMLAIDDMMRHNVSLEDISLQLTDTITGREFYTELSNKAPEYGVVSSIVVGALAGAIAALINLGQIPDAGTGLVQTTLLLATLSGTGLGMLVGLIGGLLAGASVPEYESTFHSVGGHRAGYLIGVYCHPRREFEVRKLIEAAGATSIRTRAVKDEPIKVYGHKEVAEL